MMRVRYYLDPVTESPHIYRHGVTESEVEEVLGGPREGSRVAIEQTASGRYVRVVYVPEPEGGFILTAFELRGKPLAAFKRRRRKKSHD